MEYEITGEVRNLHVHAARGNSKIWVFFEIDGVKLRGEFNDIPVEEGEPARVFHPRRICGQLRDHSSSGGTQTKPFAPQAGDRDRRVHAWLRRGAVDRGLWDFKRRREGLAN